MATLECPDNHHSFHGGCLFPGTYECNQEEQPMGNRPHPHGRRDSNLIRMSDAEFEAECDKAYLEGTSLEAAEKAARLQEYENSPEQRDWEHDDMCESEFITEAGMYSPCQCKDRDA